MTCEVCFTGFPTLEKDRLRQLASVHGLNVVKTVTRSLTYLVIGPNAGPAKIKMARECCANILTREEFEYHLTVDDFSEEKYIKRDDSSAITSPLPESFDDGGILDLPICETPTAILDFETTGLSPGLDRVVEVSIIRYDPDGQSRTVLDTLVNPQRPMGATDIHAITDADVVDAPTFKEIAETIAAAISGCVFAAYNVYFDIRFFEYEMALAGFPVSPPYLCLMYLRPLLGLGKKCSLGDACQCHGIAYPGSHKANDDAEAATKLFEYYLEVMQAKGIRSYEDLARQGTYKFLNSFTRNILRMDPKQTLDSIPPLHSRRNVASVPHATDTSLKSTYNSLVAYWDALKTAITDLRIDEEELRQLRRIAEDGHLHIEQIRMLHARVFSVVINQFIADRLVDDQENKKLQKLYHCLSTLGWAPGE